MRFMLILAYDGTAYQGWQIQDKGLTIQAEVEKAMFRICCKHVRIHGAGRTDAGVHALGQVAHFDSPQGFEHIPWQRALNSVLPHNIRIVDCREAAIDFHARFCALTKEYFYTLWISSAFFYPQRRNFVWNTGHLEIQPMKEAAGRLLGTHDFTSFMNKGTQIKDTTRTILDISFQTGSFPQELVLSIRASGFLKQMARNIVGVLVQAGRNRLSPSDISSILQSRDRTLAPATAPARGLCLARVEY